MQKIPTGTILGLSLGFFAICGSQAQAQTAVGIIQPNATDLRLVEGPPAQSLVGCFFSGDTISGPTEIPTNSGGTHVLWDGSTGNTNIYQTAIDAGGDFGSYMLANPGEYTIGLIETGGSGTCASVIAGYTYYVTFEFDGSLNPFTGATAIIQNIEPTNGSISTSTSVVFRFSWGQSETDTYWASTSIQLTNLITGTQVTLPYQDLSPGLGEYYHVETDLIYGHTYAWTPFLRSVGTPFGVNYGYNSTFTVIEAATTTWNPDFLISISPGATVGSSTLPDPSNLLSFLNVPQLLRTKVPFGYFYQAQIAIEQGIASSSAAVVPIGTLTVAGGLGLGTTSAVLFSTSTVAFFLTPAMITILRGLMLASLTVGIVIALYHRGKQVQT